MAICFGGGGEQFDQRQRPVSQSNLFFFNVIFCIFNNKVYLVFINDKGKQRHVDYGKEYVKQAYLKAYWFNFNLNVLNPVFKIALKQAGNGSTTIIYLLNLTEFLIDKSQSTELFNNYIFALNILQL